MFSTERISIVLFAVLFPICRITSGDTIELQNGDRITGTVTSMSAGRLVANTAYASGISIDWTHIKNLRTDDSVILLMKDESVYTGNIVEISSERIVIKTGKGRRLDIEAQTLDYINPPIYELNKLTYHGDMNLGAYSTDGNSHTDSLHFDGELRIRNRWDRYKLGAQYNLQKDEGKDTAKNGSISGDYNRFISQKMYALLNISAARDKFQDLEVRMTVGPGLGYEFWQSDLRNFSLEAGLNYTYEDFGSRDDDEYASLRWSVDFDYWVYRRDVQYFLTQTGLKSVEDENNLVLSAQTGIKLPVVNNLSTKFEFDFNYNNKPAPGTEETDLKYIISGGYSW